MCKKKKIFRPSQQFFVQKNLEMIVNVFFIRIERKTLKKNFAKKKISLFIGLTCNQLVTKSAISK